MTTYEIKVRTVAASTVWTGCAARRSRMAGMSWWRNIGCSGCSDLTGCYTRSGCVFGILSSSVLSCGQRPELYISSPSMRTMSDVTDVRHVSTSKACDVTAQTSGPFASAYHRGRPPRLLGVNSRLCSGAIHVGRRPKRLLRQSTPDWASNTAESRLALARCGDGKASDHSLRQSILASRPAE